MRNVAETKTKYDRSWRAAALACALVAVLPACGSKPTAQDYLRRAAGHGAHDPRHLRNLYEALKLDPDNAATGEAVCRVWLSYVPATVFHHHVPDRVRQCVVYPALREDFVRLAIALAESIDFYPDAHRHELIGIVLAVDPANAEAAEVRRHILFREAFERDPGDPNRAAMLNLILSKDPDFPGAAALRDSGWFQYPHNARYAGTPALLERQRAVSEYLARAGDPSLSTAEQAAALRQAWNLLPGEPSITASLADRIAAQAGEYGLPDRERRRLMREAFDASGGKAPDIRILLKSVLYRTLHPGPAGPWSGK